MAYAGEEKETTCVYDYESKIWTVYTCVPNHLTKLSKLGEPYWKEEEPDKHGNPRIIAGKWRLSKAQVRFAKVREAKATDEESDDEDVIDLLDDDDDVAV